MLKFFRRICQKLLSENQFSTYLLRVFGKIVLVAIGILITLQINNWNEAQKNQAQVNAYLSRIHNNVQVDTIEIQSQRIRYFTRSENVKKHTTLLLQQSHAITILKASMNIASEQYPTPNRSGNVSFKNSGYFSMIKYLAVEDALFDYFDYYQKVREAEPSLIPL